MKKLILTAACLIAIGAFAQDSIRIRNRHSSPDTSDRDTTKLKGGVLLDSIHTDPKTKEELKEMQRPPDSTNKASKPRNNFIAQNEDLSKEIGQVEERIAALKKKQMDVSRKSQLATVENKKNELKQRIKNGEVNQPGARDKWNADMKSILEKLTQLESK
jgi:hypothetical protein